MASTSFLNPFKLILSGTKIFLSNKVYVVIVNSSQAAGFLPVKIADNRYAAWIITFY